MSKRLLLIISATLFISGCSTSSKEKPVTYGFASRQLATDPIYNRLKLVNLPYVKPARDTHVEAIRGQDLSEMTTSATIISLTPASKNLEQLARDFGIATQYSAYCASTLADRQLASNAPELSGNIDQIGEQISAREGIKVVIDHQSREIRFLASIPEAKLP